MKLCYHCINYMNDEEKVCPYCGKSTEIETEPHQLIPGTMLRGRYMVGCVLGEGGFGITYIGLDTVLNVKVAIKEFFPNGCANRANTVSSIVSCGTTGGERREIFDSGKDKFLQEARTLAMFTGDPGIVAVRDFFDENNTAYIIMEYLQGQTLKEILTTNGTMSPEQAIRFLTPVMESLIKVHAQGLIHRDISPDNIMLVNGQVKLLDFGAARDTSLVGNKSLSVMLKPGYAPEEQYRRKGNQGTWTDVYAISATLYKAITGVTPDDAPERLSEDTVQTPGQLGVAMNPFVERALMKGLAIHQNDRYQTIEELMRGLRGEDSAFYQAEEAVTDNNAFVYEPVQKKKGLFAKLKGLGKKQKIVLITVALVVVALAAVIIASAISRENRAKKLINNNTTQSSTTNNTSSNQKAVVTPDPYAFMMTIREDTIVGDMVVDGNLGSNDYTDRETNQGTFNLSILPYGFNTVDADNHILIAEYVDKFGESYSFVFEYSISAGKLSLKPYDGDEYSEYGRFTGAVDYGFKCDGNTSYCIRLNHDNLSATYRNRDYVNNKVIRLKGTAVNKMFNDIYGLDLSYNYEAQEPGKLNVYFQDNGYAVSPAFNMVWESINSMRLTWEQEVLPYNGRMETFDQEESRMLDYINNAPYGFILIDEDNKTYYIYRNTEDAE